MTDEYQLQVRPKGGNSSLSPSKVRSGLVARGLRDVALLVAALPVSPSAEITAQNDTGDAEVALLEQILGVVHEPAHQGICEVCGESKELEDTDDGFCSWCRSREKEIAEIWNTRGFSWVGRPLSGIWDEDAQHRDALAKLELDAHLKQLGISARWMEMWCGFGTSEYLPLRRGQAQAYWVVVITNQKWGFDAQGDPVGHEWDYETQRRAALAIEEIKGILADLRLPLPDEWPNEWSPNKAYLLNPIEISQGLWPAGVSDQRMACTQCGEHKELIYADSICASCADALT